MPSCAKSGGWQRLCLNCHASEPVGEQEPVWPPGWRCAACGAAVPTRDDVPTYAPALADTLTGFNPAAFDRLAAIETGHFWFEPRNRLLAGLARRFFPATSSHLEVGCGTGFVLRAFAAAFPAARMTGSELHPAGLAHARARMGGRASFVQMDARHIPARGAFDLVGAFDVIEHIPEDEVVLGEIHAALAPRGGAIIAVPQHPALWSAADDYGHHVRRYSRGELESKLARAGFDVLFSTSYMAVLLPLMLASRLSRRKTDPGRLVESEFSVPAGANAVLRAALGLEVAATARGWRWPVGGSRVVVARKSGTG